MLFRGMSLLVLAGLMWGLVERDLAAADHRVEKFQETPPAEVAPAIAKTLSPHGIKVVRGTSRTVCEIWLCEQWAVKDLKPANGAIYPFAPGQLLGVVRYPRRGSDFRDQDIDSGVYTLRFGLQPVDGAHVGTSPTRDFLLLISTEKDKKPELLDYEALTARSAEAAGSAHPALLSLQRVPENNKDAIRHNEDHDWWIVRLQGKAVADKKSQAISMDLIVVGQASE